MSRQQEGDTVTICHLKPYTDEQATRILARRTEGEAYVCDYCGELHIAGADNDPSSRLTMRATPEGLIRFVDAGVITETR